MQNFGKYLGEGVLYSRYKKPGWREYIMPDRLELTCMSSAGLPPQTRLLTAYQINLIKIRKNRAPYDRWYRLVRQKADQPVLPRYGRVTEIARQAKACALLYCIEKDPAYLHKTIDLLDRLPEPPAIADLEGGKPNSGWGDYLQSAEAVPSLCVTYDLLQEELPPQIRVDTKRKVLEVVEQLVNAFKITPRNNHVTVMAIAVCTSALTFDNIGEYLYYSRNDLFRSGIDQLSQIAKPGPRGP
ncbi:MAG: hypothetical protein P8184_07060 [Calditrichia bacterium]